MGFGNEWMRTHSLERVSLTQTKLPNETKREVLRRKKLLNSWTKEVRMEILTVVVDALVENVIGS